MNYFEVSVDKTLPPTAITEDAMLSLENTTVAACDTVHLAFVVAGTRAVRDFVVVLKSLLFHRHSPLHIHFVTDPIAQRTLTVLMQTWSLSFMNYSFYSTDHIKSYISWIPNAHYSGIFGLMKLTLPSILTSIDQVIVMDIDIIIVSDIYSLWKLFANIVKQNKLIGLVENQSDWYLGTIWKNHKPWPALGRGYNTGVMLMNLEAMRNSNWFTMCMSTAIQILPIQNYTSLADQDIINSAIKMHPNIVYQLPCTWNVQLSDHSHSVTCYMNNAAGYNIIHWNSPLKLDTPCKNAPYFRELYYTFMQHDGAHLSESLLYCNTREVKSLSNQSTLEDDNCDSTYQQELRYRTHLYFHGSCYNSSDPFDVTLVSQLSMDRLLTLKPILQHWVGPVSLALYTTDTDAWKFLDYLNSLPLIIRKRTNLSVHVVYSDHHDFYPVNYLRNVALNASNTPFVFFSDIDFVPMLKLYSYVREGIKVLRPDSKKRALVVPAFESTKYKLGYPKDKQTLLSHVNIGKIMTFRQDIWEHGHAATDYDKWYTTDHPYKIKWSPNYEPYIVVARNVSRYDERFTGFGWNKVSHIIQLDAEGYEFIVLPAAFTIHLPHSPSIDTLHYRNSQKYRNCQKKLKELFIKELIKKHGEKAKKYLTTSTSTEAIKLIK